MKKIFNSRATFRAPRSVLRASVFATALATQAFAADAILFTPAIYQIGEVNQGDVKHFVLKGANVSGKEIKLETVMGQGIGMSNFKYPTSIQPKNAVVIEFDMDFSGMEGPVSPTVVLVGTDGKPYTAALEGNVKAPVFFSEKMFDAGFYTAGESREWSFYVWETDKKARPDLTLADESAKDFTIKTKNVKVKVDENGKVSEGGKIPALKITLSTKGLSREGWELKQQSIRKIVTFKSKKYPKATPEVLVIGYWK
ncbi:MAG: hypothetical protein MJZ25_05860 [Fibrobacter sp.]|nr:hypothetical protein [Fibrobacter sp.]